CQREGQIFFHIAPVPRSPSGRDWPSPAARSRWSEYPPRQTSNCADHPALRRIRPRYPSPGNQPDAPPNQCGSESPAAIKCPDESLLDDDVPHARALIIDPVSLRWPLAKPGAHPHPSGGDRLRRPAPTRATPPLSASHKAVGPPAKSPLAPATGARVRTLAVFQSTPALCWPYGTWPQRAPRRLAVVTK